MFALLTSIVSVKTMLDAGAPENYIHPNENYISGEDNWAYLNKFVQPCYAPTWSLATTEEVGHILAHTTFKSSDFVPLKLLVLYITYVLQFIFVLLWLIHGIYGKILYLTSNPNIS
jgi:hypothetical protein